MSNGNVVSAFLVGAVVGAAAALLLAPKSGEETREWISDNARKGYKEASRAVEDAVARGADAVQRGKDLASDTATAARKAYDKAARAVS
ncbi:MAG TPA: YtxH domain-containing protein [Terriglobia bacterium]|jgi:gas vesicle protein|nr:YtxH domain-containing protein [Terriglobia bacterium]